MNKRLIIYISLYFIVVVSNVFACVTSVFADNTENIQLAYRSIFPSNPASPQPDVIKDREIINEKRIESDKRNQSLKNKEKELKSTIEKTPLVGSEPTVIYYKIAVDDRLYISVWRVKDLSLEFIVGPDGKISFPLIGDIHAAGKTLRALDLEITEKLKEYVISPQVSVMVREFAGDRVTVIGEIKSPGIYKFVGKTNIVDVIALAGGFTDRAKSSSIVIVRESKDPSKDNDFIVVKVKSILKGDLSKNITIQPNDIIYISRTFVSNAKEFWNNWIIPVMNTAVDYESYKSIRRGRHRP